MHNQPRSQIFEEVYPQFEFAPLVTLAIGLAEWIRRNISKDFRWGTSSQAAAE